MISFTRIFLCFLVVCLIFLVLVGLFLMVSSCRVVLEAFPLGLEEKPYVLILFLVFNKWHECFVPNHWWLGNALWSQRCMSLVYDHIEFRVNAAYIYFVDDQEVACNLPFCLFFSLHTHTNTMLFFGLVNWSYIFTEVRMVTLSHFNYLLQKKKFSFRIIEKKVWS